MLSKSQYTDARDCPKKLWLAVHAPLEKSLPTPSAQLRMKGGQRVGQIAKQRFPGGETVRVWEMGNEEAAIQTTLLMDEDIPAIFEATFISGDLVARVDILARVPTGWRLIEVKATSKYKRADHLYDVAFQACILKELGIPIVGCSLMHLDGSYIWEGGEFEPHGILHEEDITEDVLKVIDGIPAEAASYIDLMEKQVYPPIDGEAPYFDPVIRAECKTCDFRDHCSVRVPRDHVYYLGLHHSKLKKLLKAGIRSIANVPSDTEMSDKERLRYDAFISGKPTTNPDLGNRLAAIKYPAIMIDFETLRPDLPLFVGHSPFILLPFQWSAHVLNEAPDNTTTNSDAGHSEFIHDHCSDPREAFISSLLEILSTGGSIVHYHGYEKHVINELATAGVRDADKVVALFHRFVDLREILEECYADAAFLGKTSIKNVLPVVAPHLSYKSLPIQNGDQAQIEYLRTLSGEATGIERDLILSGLRAYCKLDTWAMVEILKALIEKAKEVGEVAIA